MTATLKFILPDESNLHYHAIHALEYKITLDEIREMLRSKVKYGHNYDSTEQALEEIYQMVCASIQECYGFPE
jgi:hypothetical protein